MYYKLGQACVTNWGSYYKSGQPLLQNRAAIKNWGKMYYKLGQVLQIRAIITYWGITVISEFCITITIKPLISFKRKPKFCSV